MFSLTQAGNLTALAGLLVFVAKQFGFEVAQGEVEQAIASGVVLVGIVTSWIGRHRKGDLTVSGFRK